MGAGLRAQADTQTLQTIEDQIRRRGASSAAAARACHVCARARVCMSGGVFVSVLFSVFVIFICLVVCLRVCVFVFGAVVPEVGVFVCFRAEFDVIVYSELYRSNGHHQPWLWQVPANAPATRLQHALRLAYCDRAARPSSGIAGRSPSALETRLVGAVHICGSTCCMYIYGYIYIVAGAVVL